MPLLVIVLARDMGASVFEIGLIFSIAGTGGIIGSLVGGQLQKRFSFGQLIVVLVWANVVLFPLYALAPHFFLLGAVCALIYMLGPIYNVVQFSYRLALIPDALQGRVNSTFRLIAFGFMPVGATASGFMLEQIGPVPTVVAISLWCALLAMLTTLNRHVRNARPLAEMAH